MIPGLYNNERNKTFFFVNAEWRKFVLGSQVFAPAIPQAQRDGDFSSLSSQVLVPQTNDPGQQARFAALGLTPGQQFPGNKIPGSLIDADAKLFFGSGAMPLPNAPGKRYPLNKDQGHVRPRFQRPATASTDIEANRNTSDPKCLMYLQPVIAASTLAHCQTRQWKAVGGPHIAYRQPCHTSCPAGN